MTAHDKTLEIVLREIQEFRKEVNAKFLQHENDMKEMSTRVGQVENKVFFFSGAAAIISFFAKYLWDIIKR